MKHVLSALCAALGISLLFLPADALAAGQPSPRELRQAAENGDADAANKLGVWYEKGKFGLPRDANAAVRWYRRAADGGSLLAMHNLGDCYLNGVGVLANPAHAYAWYKKTAEAGGAIGYEDIGNFFRTVGFGGPDPATAKIWYAAAARQGRKKAQQALLELGGSRQPVTGPASPCESAARGRGTTSGTLRSVRDYGPKDSGWLLLTLDDRGGTVDILALDADQDAALGALKQGRGADLAGRSVSVGWSLVRGLDDFTASCADLRRYTPGTLRAGDSEPLQTTAAPAGKRASGDVYIGFDGLLLGAFLDGAWVGAEDLQNSPRYHGKRLWGGLDGTIYTVNGLVGECVMGALINDHPEEFEKEYGPLAEFPIFKMQTPQGNYEGKEPALFLGGPGSRFSPMPRPMRAIRDDDGRFAEMVRRFLEGRGLRGAECRMKKLVAVDLDGDGTDEHIISAEDFKGEGLAPKWGKAGAYSVILLERTVNGRSTVTPLVADLCAGDREPAEGALPRSQTIKMCADVNGDGRMEVIIASDYYEGGEYIVFTVDDGGVAKVLDQGMGV